MHTTYGDTGAIQVEGVCEALDREYGSPRHGNKNNPLDELVYIILSNRTQPGIVRAVYRRLRRRFPSWNLIDALAAGDVGAILRPAGLGKLKAGQIVGIVLRLKQIFGRATLAPLRQMSDEAAESFLKGLPGVSAKVAKCVLMYSLGRSVLPVDVHVHRVAARLGLRTKKRPDTSQDLIEAAVPRPLRYGFHVNSVAHGRAVCQSGSPGCGRCCIRVYCALGRRNGA